MFYFIFAIVFYTIGVAFITAAVIACIRYSIKEACLTEGFWWAVVLAIMLFLCSSYCFSCYKQRVQSDAIDHYIVGDVEYIEIQNSNGDTVDWCYKVIPADYD